MTFLNEPELFRLTVSRFQLLLCNRHNLTSVICLHATCSNCTSFGGTYTKIGTCSIWPTDKTQSGTTTPGSGKNCNKGRLHIPQSSKPGASLSDCLMSYTEHALVVGGLTPLQRCSILQHQPTMLTGKGVLGRVLKSSEIERPNDPE